MSSQDLACHCIRLIQLTDEADPCLQPYYSSLVGGLMGCPEFGLQQAEGGKHGELAVSLAVEKPSVPGQKNFH